MGDPNFQYFTLDEDSEVEEYVADDPNFKRKVFWYDLLEQTIGNNSRFQLIVEALLSIMGFILEIKILLVYSSYQDWKYFSWTVSILLFAGVLNLISFYNRKWLNSESVSVAKNEKHSRRTIVTTSKINTIIQILRQISFYLLLSPIFNLFYYWNEALKNENELKRPLVMRSQPQPTKHEIAAVKSIWCEKVQRVYLNHIESMLRFVPFALLQVFILVCYKDESLQDATKKAQVYIIVWQVIYLAWSCTSYASAHFNYTKTLQFQDLKETDISMLLVKVTSLNSLFYFLHNLFSILFRLYCIALLLDTIHYWTVLFMAVVYIIFNGLVTAMPTRSRLRYENPPNGFSTKSSDLISRWFNIFCSYNIKQECFIHFTCVFIILYAIPRFTFLYVTWSSASLPSPSSPSQAQSSFSSVPISEFNDDSTELNGEEELDEIRSNMTRFQLASQCGSEAEALILLQVPILSDFIKYFIQSMAFVSNSCSPHFHHIQNDFMVSILLILHCLLSFLYLAKTKNRILFENEFPVQEGYKCWTKWLTKDWIINDTYEIKKIILCLIGSDDEIVSLRKLVQELRKDGKMNCNLKCLVHNCLCCMGSHSARSEMNSISKLHILINTLWDKYVEKTPALNSNDDGSTKLYTILEKRKILRIGTSTNTMRKNHNVNSNTCDTQLNTFLEFLLENFVLEDDIIRLLTVFIEKFDDYIMNTSNSFRLANIDKILNGNVEV